MATVNEVKNEILNLRGSNVYVFGQKTKIDKEVNPYLIDVVDVLDHLSSFEVDMIVEEYDEENDEYIESPTNDVEEYLEYLNGIYSFEELEHSNTYNYGNNLSNDIDYKIYEVEGEYYVQMMVHKYGDIRANYTDYCLLKFDSVYEFLYEINELYKTDMVTINDTEYSLFISPLSETIEVSVEDETNGYIECGSIYGYFENEDEIIKAIKEEIIEQQQA